MTTHGTVTSSPAARASFVVGGDPMVSFITVTFGTGPIIIDSLATLQQSISDLDVPAEVIVVDNAHPTAGSRTRRELLLSTDGVRLIGSDRNLGFGGGCELGARHARGTVLAFVNPDIEYRPGWLPPLLDTVADPSVSIVAPVLLNADLSVQEAGQILSADGNTRPSRSSPERVIDVEYASAACWLMRRDEHERLGGFDPAYHPAYYEDVDLALRATRLGGRCVVDGRSHVVHHKGSSTTPGDEPQIGPQRATLLDRWPHVRWSHRQPTDGNRLVPS